MSDLAAALARIEAAVCDLPETHDRIDKAAVIRLIRAEQVMVPVPRKPEHTPGRVTHAANGSWAGPNEKEHDHG